MKKRIVSILLTVCMAASLCNPGAYAITGSFSDVSDPVSVNAVEVLRLMGVLDGYSDGTFHPDETLNRAQFCKMVVNAIGMEKELGRYAAITIFPDVKPSHWAAAYINLAAIGEKIISGYTDGLFHPERSVTLGQACAILLRLLGYKDADIGGIWPEGHIALAETLGLLDNVGGSGNAPMTRDQTARLFLNFLRSETSEAKAFYTLSAETTFTSLDAGAGKLVTQAGSYEMENPKTTSPLIGTRGQVVTRNGKALTFLPVETRITTGSAGAVIVYANASTQGFGVLTGNRTGYTIYKNGLPATVQDLRAGDVATWSDTTQSVLVCDTRVTALYEDCSPSQAAPTSIEILGGTVFPVVSTAADSLSRIRPGTVATFYLTADGQIAGAMENDSNAANAVALVRSGEKGNTAQLLCGTTEIPLNCVPPSNAAIASRISSDDKGTVYFGRLSNAVSGDLNVTERTIGRTKLSDNAHVCDSDGILSLEQLNRTVIPADELGGSRLNWRGEVDLAVIGGNVYGVTWYGRAVNGKQSGTSDTPEIHMLMVVCGNGRTIGPLVNTIGDVRDGAFVAVQLNRSGTQYTYIRTLTAVENVSFSAWMGKEAVTIGGRTYTSEADTPCYNRDTGRWMSLEQAMNYTTRADVYVYDGAVRILEIHS